MKYNDEQLINALLMYGSINQAAKALGLAHNTVTRRMKKPQFKQKLNDARSAYLNQAVHTLNSELTKSIKKLAEIRDNKDAPLSVQYQAADALIRHGKAYIETVEHEQRLREVEDDEEL